MTDWQNGFAQAENNQAKAQQQIDKELSKLNKKDEIKHVGNNNYPSKNYKMQYNKGEYVEGQGIRYNKDRGSYRSRGGRGGRNFESNEEGKDAEFKVRQRGRGGERGGTRGNNRGGERGRGEFRGGRGNYRKARDEQSDEDEDVLTQDQVDFIERMKKEYSQKLKGIVKAFDIGRKCIDLKFDESAIDSWANTLLSSDERYEGVKEFGWNDTATRADRFNQKKQAQIRRDNYKKIQAEKAERQKLWEQRQKEKQERYEKNKALKAEKAAKKAAEAASKAENDKEKEDNQTEQAPEGESKGKGQYVYRQKAKTEEEPAADTKPTEKPQEEVVAQTNEEENYEEYGDEEYYDEEYDQEEEAPKAEEKPQVKDVKDSEGDSEAGLLKEAAAKPQEQEVEAPKIETKVEESPKEKTPVEAKEEPVEVEHKNKYKDEKDEQAPMNVGMPAMMPMAGLKQDYKPGDNISLQQSQQIMNDAQQHMMYCWQMLQHYQVVYNQQLVYQQQLMAGTNNSSQADQQQFMSNLNMNFGMNPMMGMPGMNHGDQQNMMPPMPGMMPFYPQNGQNGNYFMGQNQTQNKDS